MFLRSRARIVLAREKGVPAEDAIRVVRPKQYVQVLEDVKASFASQAAYEGLEFVRMMSDKWVGPTHPAFAWKRSLSAPNDGKEVSDRATGVIKSAVDVVGAIKDSCRKAVFGREVLHFRLRQMYVGLALKLRKTLVPMLQDAPDAVDLWVDAPRLVQRL